ncbi:hypothetical protein [Buttiauxella sp. A111]|uniref:hypothetical protein n=1 Tax=Buttiauxella sp. A111 TaxID=2563088 RepID=UPI00160A09C5|nr:hypothetical protein [Buttiauxella sp. A111]
MATRAEMQADAAKDRLTASKRAVQEQTRLMRALGFLPPGAKPKAKHFQQLAAFQNSQAAAARAISAQRDLAAFESVGGVGAQIIAVLNNPKAKATERAIALQGMIQTIKSAPQVMTSGPVVLDENDTFLIDDHELDGILEEFGK